MAIALLALGSSPVHADDSQKARELFTQGNTYFDLGQFDKAIDAWQSGYQLKNDPGFLYNIAQAYRMTGDAQKAIFFYKRYLSNSPKAHNRAEVEQKIEALQKQLALQEQVKDLPPPGPFGPGNPGNPGNPGSTAALAPSDPTAPSAATEPPSVAVTGISQTPPATESTPGANPLLETSLEPAAPPPHRIDLRAAFGVDVWSSGVQGNAKPAFAFTLAGGYTFGSQAAMVRFRLGALFGYTFLKESESKESFTSFLVDPTIVVRLAPRFALMGDLGIGVLSIGGIKNTSALLETSSVNVNGSQALGLVRIGVAGEYDLTRNVSLFFWPAYANSPKKKYFYQDIGRFELLAGVAYRP